MAKLIFNGDKFGGKVHEIACHRTTVGRNDGNTLSIQDRSVSERHCEIYDNGEDLIVRDLGSRNGTYINGRLLRGEQAPLANGGTIKFGSVEARLELPLSASRNNVETDITAVYSHLRHPQFTTTAESMSSAATVLKDESANDSLGHTMLLMSNPPMAETTSLVLPATTSIQPARQRLRWPWLILALAGAVALLVWWLS